MTPRSLLSVVALLLASALTFGQDSPGRDSEYRIGPGDVIRVDAFTHPDISGEFPVEGDGAITYPLVGDVMAAGKTTSELSQLLKFMLERDFYVDVQIVAEVAEYHSQPVTVVGEVLKPGTYYLRGRTTLTQIMGEAGGLHPGAGPEIELRRVIFTPKGEAQEVRTFAIDDILGGGKGSEVELRSGDVIKVSARQVYFITGEVEHPGQYESVRGLTLMQAVSQAGGLAKFASQTVEVHREIDGKKQIDTYDLGKIRKGKVDDPPVHQGDVVIVRRRFF